MSEYVSENNYPVEIITSLYSEAASECFTQGNKLTTSIQTKDYAFLPRFFKTLLLFAFMEE